ncbi:MAG: hypothetical protein CMI63_20045 [Parvularcula sp.]|nr:hypothetical protein [Parvularcula sp.]
MFEPLIPSDAHKEIPRFRWRAIATTNYDLLIEKAYSECSDRLQTLVSFVKDIQPIEDKKKNVDRPLVLLKLHGSLDHIHDQDVPLILSPEHYVNYLSHRKRLFGRLEDLAFESPIIFAGYNLGDLHIRRLVYELPEKNRPRFYIVAPKSDENEVAFWNSKNIGVVNATFQDFMQQLSVDLPPLLRAPVVHEETLKSPIRRHFKTNDQASDILKRSLEFEIEHVHTDVKSDPQDAKQFYRGYDSGWGCVKQDLDFERKLTQTILFEAVTNETSDTASRLFVVTGPGGSGKTIALKRAAWTAANSLDVLTLWNRPNVSISAEAIQELYELTGKRVFLFVDRIGLYMSTIRELLSHTTKLKIPLTVVSAERSNEWGLVQDYLMKFEPTEYEIGKLSSKEIIALLDLLEKHDSLGLLKDISFEDRKEFFESRSDRHLLVALHEATLGKPFEQIVLEEFEGVIPDEAQQLYLDICTFNQFGIPIRAGTISRISGIPFHYYEERLFSPLKHLVYASHNYLSGDYEYRARHARVAQLVFRQVCTADEEVVSQFVRVLEGLDVGYSVDSEALSQIVKGHYLSSVLSTAEAGRKIYSRVRDLTNEAAFVDQQAAIFETQHGLGSLVLAEECIDKAHGNDPKNFSIIHTQAEIARKRANDVNEPILKEQLRRKTRERLSKLNRPNDKYSLSTLCKLHADELKDKVNEAQRGAELEYKSVILAEKIQDTENVLARAKQLFPNEPDFQQTEAKVHDILGNSKEAIDALEKAWRSKPKTPGVGIRLSKHYMHKGKSELAAKFLSEAQERFPDNKAVHQAFCSYYIHSGNLKDAETHAARSYSIGDSNFFARHLHGQIQLGLGRAIEARKTFQAVEEKADSQFLKRVTTEHTQVSALIPPTNGFIERKLDNYAFVKASIYHDDIFCPAALSDEENWDELRVGDNIGFEIRFARRGPIGVRLKKA